MQVPMKPEAIRSFRIMTELSLALGVVDEETFEERMAYLDELIGDPDGGPSSGHSGGGDDGSGPVPESSQRSRAHSELLEAGNTNGTPASATPPDWLRFLPAGPIGHLSRWEFIKGDPDPHPSVPHGHDGGRTFPKLDPYLGWIHISTTKTQGRLSRDDTRELWNDNRFRDFAAAALVHFAQENPNYVWRVPFPMRIPRRR